MMSLETIRELSRDAAQEAEESGKQPATFTDSQITVMRCGQIGALRRIPNLGDYLPNGWSRVELESGHGVYGDNAGFGAFMVDSSGFGRRGEPALTISEFVE